MGYPPLIDVGQMLSAALSSDYNTIDFIGNNQEVSFVRRFTQIFADKSLKISVHLCPILYFR
jgi:hypothetical protein